ncbi:MAG: hypothetical protein KJO55_08615 [Gammaproteobacteria bacterium]|nr:hypothetical protein [Gammaproteobacteria bacterium]NND61177.1 hypothetical protein [Gammaproteobacteria bacterium]
MTRLVPIAAALLLAQGCATTPPAPVADNPLANEPTETRKLPPGARPRPSGPQPVAMTFGRGIAKAADDLNFMLNVEVYEDDSVKGTFSYSAQNDSGNLDIEAEVTCVSLDNDKGRGWVGGTITRNDSTDARYTGHTEVWMRVFDRNLQNQPPMVSAPLFASGKIDSASEYCRRKPWSNEGLHLVQPGALAIFP